MAHQPEQQKERWLKLTNLPTIPTVYDDPDVIAATPWIKGFQPVFENASPRPSTVTGAKYNEVSVAFFTAVHDALTGKKETAVALEDLEVQLQQILAMNSSRVNRPPSASRLTALR